MVSQLKLTNMVFNDYDDENIDDEFESTYERYHGSYAQEVEGFSDEAIDEAFEGDPDAYWNID